jgi:hypothetical protein
MSLSTTPIYFDHFPSLLSPMWPPLFSLMWPKFQLPLYISTTSLSPLSSPVSSLSCGRNFGYPCIFRPLPSLLSPLLSSSKFRLPLYISTTSLLSSLFSPLRNFGYPYIFQPHPPSPLSSLLSSGSSPVSSLLLSPLSSLLSRMIQQP